MKCKFCDREMHDFHENYESVPAEEHVHYCIYRDCSARSKESGVGAHSYKGKWYTGAEWEDPIGYPLD